MAEDLQAFLEGKPISKKISKILKFIYVKYDDKKFRF